jgi:hypothetical protein
MYADTVSELLSAVIPGYDELPSNENGDEAASVARYEAAIELANLVQPAREDWDGILSDSQARFEAFRTWPGIRRPTDRH